MYPQLFTKYMQGFLLKKKQLEIEAAELEMSD